LAALGDKFKPLLKDFEDEDSNVSESYEKENEKFGLDRKFQDVSLTSNRPAKEHEMFPFEFQGSNYQLSKNRTWSTSKTGYLKLVKANRILARKIVLDTSSLLMISQLHL